MRTQRSTRCVQGIVQRTILGLTFYGLTFYGLAFLGITPSVWSTSAVFAQTAESDPPAASAQLKKTTRSTETAQSIEPQLSIPFTSGESGYASYRIPSILEAANGRLLAFAEGRKANASDTGDIDLVLRESDDGGRTWHKMRVLWDDAQNTCGNPCPVLDTTGTIHLLLTWNRGDDAEPQIIAGTSHDTRRVFVTTSNDHGETWCSPREITAQVKSCDWTWYATGPGAGIRLTAGPHCGRLVIPCDHVEAKSQKMRSHVIYSDDQGVTWQLGGTAPMPGVNECEVAELPANVAWKQTDTPTIAGTMVLNMRNYQRTTPSRQICRSDDGGATWYAQQHDETLIEPICQASLRRIGDGDSREYLFSNPASVTQRERMTIRLSVDATHTWSISRVLDPRPAAYSCLVTLRDGSFGCLYETGQKSPYETIVFAKFKREWLIMTTEKTTSTEP